jgi:serine/threonine-protein kinase
VPLQTGVHLGPYEIVSLVGAGGMGEVYRAKDTKLGRDVALKILPASFTNDPERVARFRREAQVLASLNHPHIGQIYGLEEANGTQFLVLELVDGESLDKRIARGPVPVDDALGIAKQIAEALEAAHEKGIIHRDLKPANIALTNDGTVKVLDFGLAKAVEATASESNLSMSPTITTPAMMTGVGVILGTAAYMSPEQAKGRAADKRSDIWAFGCVLYEMLTGQRAFEGEDVSDTLAAVLRGEPDWTRILADVPLPVRTLVQGCLEKNRAVRPSDIAVARFMLANSTTLSGGPSGSAPVPPPTPAQIRRYVVPTAVTALLTAALVSVAWWGFTPQGPRRTITRFTFPLGESQTFSNAGRLLVGLSPDATQLVYVANSRLYLRAMSELDARPLFGADAPTAVTNPVFSPDGRSIAFHTQAAAGGNASGTLKRIALTGGTAISLCSEINPYGMSWDEFGILVGQGREGIIRVSPNGGKPERLITVNANELAHGPQLLPDHETVLFTLAKEGAGASPERWDHAQIVAQSLRTGRRTTIIDGGSDARYLSSGHLVYALGGVLYAISFDARRLRTTGAPTPLVEGVQRGGAGATGVAQYSVANTGALIYVPGPVSTSRSTVRLTRFDRSGVIEPLRNLAPAAYETPRVSRDGQWIAVGIVDERDANIWVVDVTGTRAPRRLTYGGRNRFPVWSAAGTRVAFQSDREGDLGIFWQRADGVGAAERLTRPDPGTNHTPESWSKDDQLMFSTTKGATESLATLDIRSRRITPYAGVTSELIPNGAFSPDGRWVAYAIFQNGLPATYVRPFPAEGDTKYQIWPDAIYPLWSPDGRELFGFGRGARLSMSIATQPTFSFTVGTTHNWNPLSAPILPGPSYVRPVDMMPDGHFLGLIRDDEGRPRTLAPQIQIVLNWIEELKARVPTE